MTVRAEFNTCKRSQWSRQVLHDRKKLTHLSERWKKALRQLVPSIPGRTTEHVLESIFTQGKFWKINRE